MPYKPTGRPPGRPKTKEYETLTARVPQDMADQARQYAARHQLTLSEVLRDGLFILLEEDRYRPFMPDSNSVPEIVSDRNVPESAPANRAEMNGVPESVPDVLHMQRLREIVSDTIQVEEEPEIEIVADTIQEGEEPAVDIASDTNCPHSIPLAYDANKYRLGQLCKRGHDYQDTGQSLRNIRDRVCKECKAEGGRNQHAAKRQAQPA